MSESNEIGDSTPGTFPHLARAPINEALIDFQVKLPPEFDVAAFRDLKTKMEPEFPRMEEISQLQLQFQFKPESGGTHNQKNLGLHGVFFHSVDGKAVAQFRRDGFTFNRLKPYTAWNDVFSHASRFWRLYAQTVRKGEVTRIATRYINRMEFPLTAPLSHFIRIQPPIPQEWPPAVLPGFLMRVVLGDLGAVAANVVLAIEEGPENMYIPVIFDIDVFERMSLDIQADALLERFSELRAMKNKVFFSSLTEEAIAIFK